MHDVQARCELMPSVCITGIVVALKEPKWDLSIRSICVPFVVSEWSGVLLWGVTTIFLTLAGKTPNKYRKMPLHVYKHPSKVDKIGWAL